MGITEEGIVAAYEYEDRLEGCPDLQTGRYRYVYRGICCDDPLAVTFDYDGELVVTTDRAE